MTVPQRHLDSIAPQRTRPIPFGAGAGGSESIPATTSVIIFVRMSRSVDFIPIIVVELRVFCIVGEIHREPVPACAERLDDFAGEVVVVSVLEVLDEGEFAAAFVGGEELGFVDGFGDAEGGGVAAAGFPEVGEGGGEVVFGFGGGGAAGAGVEGAAEGTDGEGVGVGGDGGGVEDDGLGLEAGEADDGAVEVGDFEPAEDEDVAGVVDAGEGELGFKVADHKGGAG